MPTTLQPPRPSQQRRAPVHTSRPGRRLMGALAVVVLLMVAAGATVLLRRGASVGPVDTAETSAPFSSASSASGATATTTTGESVAPQRDAAAGPRIAADIVRQRRDARARVRRALAAKAAGDRPAAGPQGQADKMTLRERREAAAQSSGSGAKQGSRPAAGPEQVIPSGPPPEPGPNQLDVQRAQVDGTRITVDRVSTDVRSAFVTVHRETDDGLVPVVAKQIKAGAARRLQIALPEPLTGPADFVVALYSDDFEPNVFVERQDRPVRSRSGRPLFSPVTVTPQTGKGN